MRKILILISVLFTAQTFANDKVEIVLNWKPEPEFGAFYQALNDNLYQKQGLDVTLTPGGAGIPSLQMVASKKNDFGITNADDVVIAQSHGAKVVAIFAVYQTTPFAIMTHAEQNFNTLEDLYNSKTVLAIESGLPFARFLKAKFPNAKAQFVPYLGGVTNFLGDKNFSQQGFSTSEPLLAEKKGVKTKVFPVADAGFNPYSAVVVTREDVIQKHPELVKKVVLATREGMAAYLANPDQTNVIMNKINPAMDLATFKESAKAQENLIQTSETSKSGLGSMTLARWTQLTDQLKDLGLITKKPDPKTLFKNY